MKCHDEEMGRGRKVDGDVVVIVDDHVDISGGPDVFDEDDSSDDDGGKDDYSEDQLHGDGDSTGSSDEEYANAWPRSYRASIDMMSSVTPPKVAEFLGESSFSRLGQSFLRQPSLSTEDNSVTTNLLQDCDIVESQLSSSPQIPTSDGISKSPSTRRSFLLSYHGLSQTPSDSSFTQAFVNGINVLCGVGILSIPYAIKNGGWFGLVILIGLGIISCYTGILLKRCLDSSPGLTTYPDIGQAAFGTVGRYGIAAILYMELYASCVEYIILVSDNLSMLFPEAHIFVARQYMSSHQLFAVTAAITVLPSVLLRDLSLLSYLSAGGVVASIMVVSCLIWVGAMDGVGFHPAGSALDLTNLPIAIGLYGFCFGGHSVFPNIYSSMKKKSDFPIVLIICFFICTIVYAGVASIGFSIFGDSITSQFTLNMPPQLTASKIAVWTTVINPLTKYALTITPVALSLEELLPESRLQFHSASVFIRTTLVFSTLLVALVVPSFGFVMALAGSSLAMLLALILPCACYLSIQRQTVGKTQAMVCILVAVIGITCAITGTFTTMTKMV